IDTLLTNMGWKESQPVEAGKSSLLDRIKGQKPRKGNGKVYDTWTISEAAVKTLFPEGEDLSKKTTEQFTAALRPTEGKPRVGLENAVAHSFADGVLTVKYVALGTSRGSLFPDDQTPKEPGAKSLKDNVSVYPGGGPNIYQVPATTIEIVAEHHLK